MYYFDHSATTPLHPDVVELMHNIQKYKFGNPSSTHKKGREAKLIIENSRNQIAHAIGVSSKNIIFTSGGTESNNQVLWSMLGNKKSHILSNYIEHPAVLNVLKYLKNYGIDHDLVSVDNNGLISIQELKNKIKKDTALISVMLANNEIGTIQPVEEIVKIAHEKGILVHSDAVQCLGKMHINVDKIGADFFSLSAHKFYGPKGVGILYFKNRKLLSSFIIGGSQEKNLRAGTEDTASIAGMGLAAEIAVKNLSQKVKTLVKIEKEFLNRLKAIYPKFIINGHKEKKLPGVLSVSFPDFRSDFLMAKLDRENIYVSNGAACGSGDIKPSKILKALSLKDEINISTLRFSFGVTNTIDEIQYLINVLNKILNQR